MKTFVLYFLNGYFWVAAVGFPIALSFALMRRESALRTENARLRKMFSLSFLEGMIDGIKTTRKEIAKLGALYEKPLGVCDRLLRAIDSQRKRQ